MTALSHRCGYHEVAKTQVAMTLLPLAPPTPSAQSPSPLEAADGPLWRSVKHQLYKSEVCHVKRLVGEPLIQQNQLMWEELSSLRQIHSDFQERNDELQNSFKRQVQFCGTQHRDLLKRQAQIMLDDLRQQAAIGGHHLEDIVPELKDPRIVQFLSKGDVASIPRKPDGISTPPQTPSTRPSSSSGCSTTPSRPSSSSGHRMPLGKHLEIDDLTVVAEGMRAALEAEHAQLLAAIGEQIELIEAEDTRRTQSAGGVWSGEPSTAELQAFLHKLQESTVSAALRTLTLVSPAEAVPASSPEPQAITGGASVRRLQTLIADRRRASASRPLGAVPEASSVPAAVAATGEPQRVFQNAGKPAQNFDPFFDDPFA
jgi:hypothetical protein